MPPPSSIELVKEIKGHVLIESVRECQKKRMIIFWGVVSVLVSFMQECYILWNNLEILRLTLSKYATWLIVEHILVSRNILVAIWWRPHLGTSAPCPGSGSRSRLTTRITSLFHRNRIFPVPSLARNSLQKQRPSTLLLFFSTNHPRPSPSNHSIHFPPLLPALNYGLLRINDI